jgi:nitroreductase
MNSITGFDLSCTDRLLSTTRSVRKRLDLSRQVEQSVLLDCVRVAQQAPSGGNRQGWRWLFVTEPAKKRELAGIYREVAQKYFDAARAARPENDLSGRALIDSGTFLVEQMEHVPVLAIACIDRPPPQAAWFDYATVFASILPSVWSFQLALRSRGLGSCLTTFHLLRESEVAKLLQIPDSLAQVALLPVAYTTGSDFRPADRPPAQSIVSWNGWSQGASPT